jgi:hypothetical protein
MKLGIALDNLGPSQLAHRLLAGVETILKDRTDLDVVLFYENLARPCLTPCCACMQLPEAFRFDGTMVATSLSTAAKVLRFPGPRRRLFLAWDLEWLRRPGDFVAYQSLYGHPALELLGRGPDQAQVLRQAFNRPVVAVTDDSSLLGQLLTIAGDERA